MGEEVADAIKRIQKTLMDNRATSPAEIPIAYSEELTIKFSILAEKYGLQNDYPHCISSVVGMHYQGRLLM